MLYTRKCLLIAFRSRVSRKVNRKFVLAGGAMRADPKRVLPHSLVLVMMQSQEIPGFVWRKKWTSSTSMVP